MKGRILKKVVDNWILKYHIIIPILITLAGTWWCWNYKIYLWNSQYYGDMLTAVITFLSIVISVFGILIPTVFTNKNKLTTYFVKNIDRFYFVKSVKNVMVSGISDVILVCILYSYDVIPKKVYALICIASLFLLIYFLCGSYKYLSLMLRLVLEDGEIYDGKRYNKQISDTKRKEINEMLRNNQKK